jgi:HD-GYP domain-containing protein (c-di-GMP phosphodiesterase class II)
MTPDEKSPLERARRLHQLAVEMVVRQNVILKSARIYEPNNLIFSRQIGRLHSLIQTAFAEFGEAVFTVRPSTLFFNGLRLKFGFANYHFFKFVSEEYRKRGIGVLRFEPGVTEDEIKRLALAMVKGCDGRPTDSLETLAAEMERQGIAGIRVEETLETDLGPSRERSAAKVFFLGLTHLGDAFRAEQQAEKVKLGTTRRLMQSIFDHLVDNEWFLQGLTNIKDFHEYTLNHSMNVCILSIALGRRLGLDRNELVDLGLSAFFHDFGKLDTPRDILEKPAKLDDRERKIIEKHPHHGAEKLIRSRDFRGLPLHAIHVALEHHVKEDLTGYPRPYRKHTVNLFSRIVKITDFFDAITTKRVYRTTHFTRDEALTLMLAQSGREFHPALLREFVKMMGVYPVGSLVALDTGELGIVTENSPETNLLLRPKVRIVASPAGERVVGELVDLGEVNPETEAFLRTIVKTLDPEKYNVRVADYFLDCAQA